MISTCVVLWTFAAIIHGQNGETNWKIQLSLVSRSRDSQPLPKIIPEYRFLAKINGDDCDSRGLNGETNDGSSAQTFTDDYVWMDPHLRDMAKSCFASVWDADVPMYTQFIQDYCSLKKWVNVFLLVPENYISFCNCVRLILMEFSITCVYKLPDENKITKMPIISLQFLAEPGLNLSLYSKILSDNELRVQLLIVGSGKKNLGSHDSIGLRQTNYKWTWVTVNPQCMNHLQIFDVFGIATANHPIVHQFGFWSPTFGVKFNPEDIVGLQNFQQSIIRVTTVAVSNFWILRSQF